MDRIWIKVPAVFSVALSILSNYSNPQSKKVFYKNNSHLLSHNLAHEIYYKKSRDTLYGDIYPIIRDTLFIKIYVRNKENRWIHKDEKEAIEECCFQKQKRTIKDFFGKTALLYSKIVCE